MTNLSSINQPPQTRTQYVADILRERILHGKITGGEALTQQSIAEEFNVSRIPVREALLLLQAEGLIEIFPHRGAYVVELSAEKISELFELRNLLEVSLLRDAIPHLTAQQLDQAETILNEYNIALNSGKSIDQWSNYNEQFHMTLYKAARKPETLSLVEILNVRCARYIRIQLLYTQKIHKAQKEHAKLLQLCREKRIEEACQILSLHITESYQSIIELLATSK